MSKKHETIKRKLIKIYKEIALERSFSCTGCGMSGHSVPLSHSHIIPRSRRADLTLDKRNITYHCLSIDRKGCHDKWESSIKMIKGLSNDYEWTNESEYTKQLFMLSTIGYIITHNDHREQLNKFLLEIGKEIKENQNIIKQAKHYAYITKK